MTVTSNSRAYYVNPPKAVNEALTPPPSPGGQRGSCGDMMHWGYLKPLNVEAPFKSLFFSRMKSEYTLGESRKRDICIRSVATLYRHQCTFMWNGTDDSDAVRVIDYSGPETPLGDSLPLGTYLNGTRMEHGVEYVLHHGDEFFICATPVMAPDEDLRFVWLQCKREGWLPLEYWQDSDCGGPLNSMFYTGKRPCKYFLSPPVIESDEYFTMPVW